MQQHLCQQSINVIAAALRYRDVMRQYMAGQEAAIEQGASLGELVLHNQEGFQAAAQAEGELFALLDKLDAMQMNNGTVLPEPGQRS